MSYVRRINNIKPASHGSIWNARVEIDLTGLREISNKFNRRVLTSILMEEMQPMLETAKALCPVSQPPFRPTVYHGALRDSIELVERSGYEGVGVTLRAGNTQVFYGPYVEFGGRYGAQPFLRPAWDQHSMEIKEGVLERLRGIAGATKRGRVR